MTRRLLRFVVAWAFAAALALPVAGASPSPAGAGDGAIDLAALRHDSRDPFFRSPAGAVPAGTTVLLRLETLAGDATGVEVRLNDAVAGGAKTLPMSIAAAGVPCVEPGSASRCDVWELAVPTTVPTTLSYRFTAMDGDAAGYYADDRFDDGGVGKATAYEEIHDYVVTVYDPAFEPIPWLAGAVIYQVFPDRFANGDPSNDPSPDEPRYGWPPDEGAQVQLRRWGELPEQPGRGRDFFGGDLAGLTKRLDYLQWLGVTVIYLNPIFEAGSNHRYDTRDWTRIDDALGAPADWERLVAEADRRGIRIVLDGVFNHGGADGALFDRYGHDPAVVGACERVDSPYRSWFLFRDAPGGGPCAGPNGPGTMGYVGWAGYDSLPVLSKGEEAVRDFIFGADDSIARRWLRAGAAGWRLDVMPDGSFPKDFWPAFRRAVKETEPDAAIVGELWKRNELLRFIRGDAADSWMNYRFRDAVIAYLATPAPGAAEDESLASTFASRIDGIGEDVPPAAAAMALNLLDSHDTERILWSLTPGASNRREREEDQANASIGKARLRLATLLQFTLPGAPTVYYGDEVGMTGAGDPDDRRTFPADEAGRDLELLDWYRELAALRAKPVFREGDLRFLLADDATGALAFARRAAGSLAIVAVNPASQTSRLQIPLRSDRADVRPIRDGIRFRLIASTVTSSAGILDLRLEPRSGVILVAEDGQDLDGPRAPEGLGASVTPDGTVELRWEPDPDAAAYEVWRSPLAGGGYELVGTTAEAAYEDRDVASGATVHYALRAVDAAGNVSPSTADLAVTAEVPTAAPSGPEPSASPAPGPSGPPSLAPEIVGALALAWFAAAAVLLVVARRRRT